MSENAEKRGSLFDIFRLLKGKKFLGDFPVESFVWKTVVHRRGEKREEIRVIGYCEAHHFIRESFQ